MEIRAKKERDKIQKKPDISLKCPVFSVFGKMEEAIFNFFYKECSFSQAAIQSAKILSSLSPWIPACFARSTIRA